MAKLERCERYEPGMNRSRQVQILVILLCFTVLGVVRHLHNYGEDLASSYIGCRLLAAGQQDHLYSHNSSDFSIVGDSAWYAMARQTGYGPLGLLHPYVQTPLWAYSLEPVCTRMRFRPFCDGYLVLFMLCTSGTLWLVAKYWTPALLYPLPIAVLYGGLYISEPFKYAIYLAQTHILYMFMTVLALILAERRRPVWAGVLLALAAAVKITPGFLILYWLMTRRTKAALSFVCTFAAVTALTVLLLGSPLMHAYLHSLAGNSNVLLLAFNNQSLAAWWMGLRGPRSELRDWTTYQLPVGLKILSTLLILVSSVMGGWMDRVNLRDGSELDASARVPPFGALFATLGATIFANIAWTHYFILLILPVMFLLQAAKAGSTANDSRAPLWIGCTLLILLLNLYPITFRAVHIYAWTHTLARAQFYASLLAMAALAVLAQQGRRAPLELAGSIRS